MTDLFPFRKLCPILSRRPQAFARVRGSKTYSAIRGFVYFYPIDGGVLVAASIQGLPEPTVNAPTGIFGFHIHSGSRCSGTAESPFADTLGHYNPAEVNHPNHAGDLPPLFGNHGYAFQVFFTDRFSAREILGKTVVIHSHPDDFTSQPAGNSGEKIACGQIEPFGKGVHFHAMADRSQPCCQSESGSRGWRGAK